MRRAGTGRREAGGGARRPAQEPNRPAVWGVDGTGQGDAGPQPRLASAGVARRAARLLSRVIRFSGLRLLDAALFRIKVLVRGLGVDRLGWLGGRMVRVRRMRWGRGCAGHDESFPLDVAQWPLVAPLLLRTLRLVVVA